MRKKRVKGGILIYGLFLSLVFGMLFQFYLQSQVTARRHMLLTQKKLIAEVMVTLAKKEKLEEKGKLQFNQGQLTYQKIVSKNKEEKTEFQVRLNDGTTFNFKK